MSKRDLYTIVRTTTQGRPEIIEAVMATSEKDAIKRFFENMKFMVKIGHVYAKKPSAIPEFRPKASK